MIKDDILLIGCGRMGGALFKGLLPKVFSPNQIMVIETNSQVAYDISQRYQVAVVDSAVAIPDYFRPQLVIIAVKPQVVGSIIKDVGSKCEEDTLFVSIVAGKTIEFFAKSIGPEKKLIRGMPNLPAMVGEGITALCANQNVTPEDQRRVAKVFDAVGESFWVQDESMIDAVTAVSGSGPAYVFHFIECMAEAGVKLGLPKKLANALARSTVIGSIGLVKSSDETPTELREQVTSPSGTTEAALNVLMHNGVMAALMYKAIEVARDRSIELAD